MYHVFYTPDRAHPLAEEIHDYLNGDITAAEVNWHPLVFNADFDYNDPAHCEKVILSYFMASLNEWERLNWTDRAALDAMRFGTVQAIENKLLTADEDDVFRFQERL